MRVANPGIAPFIRELSFRQTQQRNTSGSIVTTSLVPASFATKQVFGLTPNPLEKDTDD
jgi:hypothetical protein